MQRRWKGSWKWVVGILAGIAIGVTAFNAGVHVGIARVADHAVVLAPGFFPFGLFLGPLFVIAAIFLIGGAFRRRAWEHSGGPGPWGGGGREQMIREWHERLHAEGAGTDKAAPPDRPHPA